MPPTFQKDTGREISPFLQGGGVQQGHRTEKLIFCGFSFPQALQIAPEQGVMQPGESIPCFITLQPSGIASLCSIDLVCEVRPGRNVCIPIAGGGPALQYCPSGRYTGQFSGVLWQKTVSSLYEPYNSTVLSLSCPMTGRKD